MSTTPIFDLKEALPEPPKWWVRMLIGMLIGLLVTAIVILADQQKVPQWNWPAFNGLLIIPGLYAAIFVHELGHLAAGQMAGWRSGGIAVGGFMLLKSGRNWVMQFEWHRCVAGFFKPLTNDIGYGRWQSAVMVTGGPLASIALTVAAGAISARYGSGIWDWIGSLFWISLFVAIITLAPFSAGVAKSDGARLWTLWRHPKETAKWMAILRLQTEEADGVRPREWSQEAAQQTLTVEAKASEYSYCQLMAFYRRMDEGAAEAAIEHLERVLAKSARLGNAGRHGLFLEAAYTSAMIRRNPEQARTWRERACRLRKTKWLDPVNAAIAMCEGQYEEAAGHWEAAGERATRRKLDSGVTRFAREKWAEYAVECRQRLL